jgi:predicted nucleotidyltransferase
MYNKTCLEILELIYTRQNIHKREMSKKLKIGMPSINYAVKKMNKLFINKKEGNLIKYRLNYSNKDLTQYLYSVENSRLKKLQPKIKIAINEFLEELKEKPIIATIFGSYARGDFDENSDIDILLVYNKVEDTQAIENTAKKISLNTNVIINPVYIDYISFKRSFHNTTKKFFKNLKNHKILLIGIEWWRQMENENF